MMTSGIDKKEAEKQLYNNLTEQINNLEVGGTAFFLNFGYLANENPQYARKELPAEYKSRHSAKLVLEVIGDCEVDDREVLDVGCGRGGTVTILKNFFSPKRVTGLDLSPNHIAFCRATHQYDNVTFMEGDAENLPFADASIDIVTNIESACCYPNVRQFYREVYRVLRSGGHFLYADLIYAEELEELPRFFEELGFTVARNTDISENVILSSDEIAPKRMALAEKLNAEGFMDNLSPRHKTQDYKTLMADLLCAPGSENYNNIKNKVRSYRIFKLAKK